MCLQSAEGKEFTAKDTAAVAMHTFDFGRERDARQEPVQAAELCAGLEEEEEEGESKKDERMKGVRDALCLVMTALRKLPVVEGCDAVPRDQEGGGPEAVQGAAAGLLCGVRSRPHRLT